MADLLNVNIEQPTILRSAPELISTISLSEEVKQALLDCFENVAWVNDQGQTYYDALYDALYPPVNLTSISCVYTQSGTVYDSDSLNSLKSDLVVTAHYSDQSTETVTTYTLSGSLTEGTSTITVSYLGKTTTFTVTVTEGVPVEYTRYDYIYCTDSSDTAKYPNSALIPTKTYANLNAIGVEFEYESAVSSTGDAIFGGRTSTGATNSYAFYSGTTRMPYHLHGVDTGVTIPQSLNERHTVIFTQTSASPSTITFDGTDYSITWSNNNTLNTYLSLFTNHVSSSTSNNVLKDNIKLGIIIVKDISGNIINKYFPVVRNADNVIGLYDNVEDVFYTCSSSQYATIGNTNCPYAVGNWA